MKPTKSSMNSSIVFISRWWLSRLLTLFLAFGFFFAAGCETNKKKPVMSGESVQEEGEIDFFDAGTFDNKLYSALSKNQPLVTVNFPQKIKLNNIPERLDKWFSQVEKHEGTVELQAEPERASRGLITELFSLVVGTYNIIKEKLLYAPIKNYNATIYYLPSAGEITKVIFTHK